MVLGPSCFPAGFILVAAFLTAVAFMALRVVIKRVARLGMVMGVIDMAVVVVVAAGQDLRLVSRSLALTVARKLAGRIARIASNNLS